MSDGIHIISFDVPYPANYGGVIDVYYKLVWLKKAGIKVYLHCFTYGRKEAPELEILCEKVYYYKRKTGFISNLSLLPYTVKSRQSKELEKNLLLNDYPILFEVLHTCYLLIDPRFKNRKKIYRHSNIEHDYYLELSKSEKNLFKKIYLKIESLKLNRFESIINNANIILAVNENDAAYFKLNYPKIKTVYLPSFHANETVTTLLGRGNYILFHGNLSISENYVAVSWLINYVYSKVNVSVIIAGLAPPNFLIEEIKKYPNIRLINSPDENEMDSLIHNAQINVLYTKQPTGLKLKLLNVLFKGRYIICNPYMVEGISINENSSFMLAKAADDFIKKINSVFELEFSSINLKERKLQTSIFENTLNCEMLIQEIKGV